MLQYLPAGIVISCSIVVVHPVPPQLQCLLTERRVDETFMVIVFLFAEKVVLLESYLLLSSVFYRYERLDKQQIHPG